MGLGADLTLVGKDLIRIIMGPQWGASGRIFTFFGPGIGIMLVYGTHGWIHLSIGRAERWFRWGIIELTVTGLLFVLALPWGPAGIATAWTASFWILTVPAFRYAGRPINFGIAPILSAVWKYLLASLLAGVASAEIIGTMPSLLSASDFVGAVRRVVVISLLFGALYLGGVILLYRGFAPLNQVVKLVPVVLPFASRFSNRQSPLGAMSANPASKSAEPMGEE
jgi:PST family polysaccharide transporter